MNCRNFKKNGSVLPGNIDHFPTISGSFGTLFPLSRLGTGNILPLSHRTKILHIVKARLFCRYLKGSSLRVIYSYFEQEQRIEFIEIYFKGDKENEDRHRVKEYLTKYQD